MQIVLEHDVPSAVQPTAHVLEVAAMFGLGIDRDKRIPIIPRTELRLSPGRIVFVTGSSGGGKSTLLRLIREQIDRDDGAHALSFDALPAIQDRPLVDGFPGRTLNETLRLLSLAGLNDAFVMLRKPSELSDGQRYRLKLAQVMAMIEANVLARHTPNNPPPSQGGAGGGSRPEHRIALRHTSDDANPPPLSQPLPSGERGSQTPFSLLGPLNNSSPFQGEVGRGCKNPENNTSFTLPQPLPQGRGVNQRSLLKVILADEFCATLDRVTAKVIARNVRKWVRSAGVCFVAATTHDDLLEPLDPDILIEKHLGGRMDLLERPAR